jgi:hypothetical protein
MELVIHRVNTIEQLRTINPKYGVEVDLRTNGSELVMNHEPFRGGCRFADYLGAYHHGLMVLNIKESGIESEVLRLVRQRAIHKFFLLDVEFPYIYQASRQGERAIAVRYSEDECIETVLNYEDMVDWIWIDTNTQLPLDCYVIEKVRSFNTCLVCPERWGRPTDISLYAAKMRDLGFCPDAIMTSLSCASQWECQNL